MAFYAVTATNDLTDEVEHVLSYHFAENAGTPAEARVLLRDGSSTGTVVCDIRIAASDSKALSFDRPLHFPKGVYVEIASGTVRGAVDGN